MTDKSSTEIAVPTDNGQTTDIAFPVDWVMTYSDLQAVDTEVDEVKGDKMTPEQFRCGRCSTVTTVSNGKRSEMCIFGESRYSDDDGDSGSGGDDDSLEMLTVLECKKCLAYVAMLVGKTWWSIDRVLRTKNKSGLQSVRTFGERIILWLLNQVVHMQYEDIAGDCPFLPNPKTEEAKILWWDGQAVGFYTIKPKGSELTDMEFYRLPVVDLIYVRAEHRKLGLATRMVEDFAESHPAEDVGISSPISKEFWSLLKKFLKSHPECRDYFWEVSWTGEEGYKKNIWLQLHKRASTDDVGVQAEPTKLRKVSDS